MILSDVINEIPTSHRRKPWTKREDLGTAAKSCILYYKISRRGTRAIQVNDLVNWQKEIHSALASESRFPTADVTRNRPF